jgi:hypothetical protein
MDAASSIWQERDLLLFFSTWTSSCTSKRISVVCCYKQRQCRGCHCYCRRVLRDGEPVIEIRSSFLYCGRFSDYQNAFQIIEELDYVVELNDASAAGVLQSREWFDWDDNAKPLLPGMRPIFRVETEIT